MQGIDPFFYYPKLDAYPLSLRIYMNHTQVISSQLASRNQEIGQKRQMPWYPQGQTTNIGIKTDNRISTFGNSVHNYCRSRTVGFWRTNWKLIILW